MARDKKYYTLYKTLKGKILSGEYKPDQKLPSKRTMADMTSNSVITVQGAYDLLSDEGYIYSKERSGYYVAEFDPLYIKEADNVRALPLLNEENDLPSGDFEYSVWFKTLRKVISDKGEKLFVKSPAKGCAVLRNAISEYLYRYRGMYAEPERIIIGSGAEQLYDTVVRLFGRDKIYAIEDPSYAQIETVYEGMGVTVEKLKMGSDGIESDALISSRANVLHVTPFHSYPSGVTASAKKRHEYLAFANKNGGYIVEDDFDSEFFVPGNPIESLYSLDSGNRVLYMNTFSKSLSPSMRMGYMVLPRDLLGKYDEKMSMYSCTVPVIDQYVLAEFIKSGNFERHLNRMRRKMKEIK
ncbi:MAG: PLP-dependent aminotransferase family protein [Ruminococcaceae bacterium]|nr:PLP-dependent aminotransferase family protein [Oscillospiraceae bacterium]